MLTMSLGRTRACLLPWIMRARYMARGAQFCCSATAHHMKIKHALALIIGCLAAGCDSQEKPASAADQTYAQQSEAYGKGLKRADENLAHVERQTKLADEQLARYGKLLDKWEEQAKRMDAILDRLEKDQGLKK